MANVNLADLFEAFERYLERKRGWQTMPTGLGYQTRQFDAPNEPCWRESSICAGCWTLMIGLRELVRITSTGDDKWFVMIEGGKALGPYDFESARALAEGGSGLEPCRVIRVASQPHSPYPPQSEPR